MRYNIVFCPDCGIYVVYETKAPALRAPSENVWLIPGTHADDPSFRA